MSACTSSKHSCALCCLGGIWISVMLCACCICMLSLHPVFARCLCMLCLHAVSARCLCMLWLHGFVCMLLNALLGHSTRQHVCFYRSFFQSVSLQKLIVLFQKWKTGRRKYRAVQHQQVTGLSLPVQDEPCKHDARRKQEAMPNAVHQFALISVAHAPTMLLHTTAYANRKKAP